MSEAHFRLIFRGPGVENGEIDVQDFAPALLAAGELMQSANDVINGDNAKVSVKIRATSEGSFEVDLSILQHIVDSIFTFSKENRDGITAANELAALVLKNGAIAAGCGGGLIALLKWLRGRKPEKVEETGGGIHIQIGDQIFITDKKAVALAENIEVRKQARKLVSALDRNGIESIGFCQNGSEEISIGRQDVRSFDIPEDDEEEIEEEIRSMTLQIISLSFKEDNKWRLTDGGEPFAAAIEDTDFLNKIAKNEVVFGKGDYLRCKVRERQILTSKGLRKDRSIIEVIEHKGVSRQLRLL